MVVRVVTTVAATRIYRKNPVRVIAFHNRLSLSLSKRIRHGLVAKLNDKRRSQACEVLDRISMDYSLARYASAPITSPRPAPSGEASECTRVFSYFSSPLHTYKCIESNPPYK
jgi:hypothetical protein